ncbi:unnamed protein product [Coregonus sp. 'balchen']|nr:unnamed protein product [Coregonus sp. 'balchen']
MARIQQLSWLLLCLLFLVGLECDQGEHAAQGPRSKRDISNEQPRMVSESGHLVFSTHNKEIRFQTSGSGSVKVGTEDLTQLMSQIKTNKADIDNIKQNGGGTSPDVTNQLNTLNAKVSSLETKVTALEQTVQRKTCTSNPCQNGATCLDLLDSFHCMCPSNWGGPNCAVDVNECQIFVGTSQGCQNGATCINTPGSFTCTCSPEWSGTLCTTRYDDCQGAAQDLCVHGTCIDADRITPNVPKFKCVCDDGWMAPAGNPACISDVDECSLAQKPCSTNPPVTCYNTQGSFYCGSCPAGWQGNGYSCLDVNECSTNNGGCSTTPMVQCLNTMGSFHCGTCPPGYEGDGRTCTQANICANNNGGCYPQATCSSTPGAIIPVCTCPPDYTGNGYGPTGCTQSSNICQTNNPCVNGQCVPTSTGYLCTCSPGWGGVNCDQNVNECASNPCQNGVCGGYLTGPAGTFSYPNTPGSDQYDHQVSCAWVIRADANKILRITFPHFELENSANCDFDFLQIHDGESASAYQLGKYCGTSTPAELFSSHNALYFWFRSDHSVNAGGFTVAWTSQTPVCGGELTEPHGNINSPGYPGNYPPNRDCYWTVDVAPGLLITFAFGTLSLENHPDCNYDYLEIRDGLRPEDPVLGKYCSNVTPAPRQTTGPAAWIRFHSDFSNSDRGFHITYTTSPSDPGCGGTFTESEGIIISPNWPNNYAHNRQCIYIIRLPANEIVRDGTTETDPLIGKYCGYTIPAPILSSSNALWIRFKSDASISQAGFRATYEVGCGGTFSGTGQIRSPYHPDAYPHNKECEWVINQPQGYVVTLNFLTFDIESGSCVYDFVERSMYIRFKTDSSVSNHGFTASYDSAMEGCGTTLNAPSGSLTSPGHPNNYPHGANCTWYISVAPGNLIRLSFTSFNMEYHTSCNYDYVEVYDNGTVATGTKLGRYCGRSVPPSLTSTDNLMTVLFVSDISLATEGFSANYVSINATTDCSETFTSPTGELSSPNFPSNYPTNRQCIYKIIVGVNMQIMLNFTDFTLEGSPPNCALDYVEIRDGGYETSPLIGKFCSTQRPPMLVSHSNRLWLMFRSDYSVTFPGFRAHWDGTQTGCGGTLTTSSGGFSSPNYPLPYHTNAECYWLIKASAGSLITLSFGNFDLESSTSCTYDYLALYNGPNDQAPLIGSYCGNTPPPANTTTSSSLHVVFRTDSSIAMTGFQMLWYQNGCGGDLSGPTGSFNSPGYPNRYPENRECIWHIQTATGSSITITIYEFDVEYHPDCNYDVLEVYGGPDLSAPRLAQLCTTTSSPLQVSSTGNMVTVRFKSDPYVSGRGFNASWVEVQGGCGGPIKAPSGEIHSPNYPANYPNTVDCSWTISVDVGHRVLFNFTDLDIELHSMCQWDHVAIYDGPSMSAPLLGQVCGQTRPSPITSTQNTIFVRFRSDASLNHRGFAATFSEACGATFLTDDVGGAIASPRYPAVYPANQNCSWIIKAQLPFNHVTLSFTDFELESLNSNCSHDAVEILDGDNYMAPVIGRYCGTEIPHPVTSFSNALVVNFVSDSSVAMKGFRATYTGSTSSCGGDLIMETGAFNSPNYPDAYPPNVECVWTITSSPGNRLQLSFIMFQLQQSSDCNNDYLEIREGNSTGALVGRFCGDSLPSNYTSLIGHVLWVKFRSDSSLSGAGFRATFSHLYGNDITGTSGQIASPLYPRTYPNNADYRWTITVPGDDYIQIHFLDIDIEDLYDCYYDQLKIFDGPNIHAYSLGTFCGLSLPASVSSSGSTVTLEFQSDSVLGGRGFLIEWSAIQSSGPLPTIAPGACGGALMPGDSPRFLFSPGWPDSYDPNLECTWVIRETNLSPLLNTVCGRELPGPIHSTGDSMFLRFTSDSSVSGKGFNASYSKGCGGLLHADRGVLSTPRYPENYPSNLDCSWHVMVTPGFRVSVNIQSPFQLRNGPDASAPSLGGRLCGTSPPSITQTTDNNLHIRFISDATNEGSGFKLTFEAHSQACGGGIELSDSDPPGYITSPNYPQNYPQNVDCIWVITVPNGESVQIDFEDEFDIEPTSNCFYDYIELLDGATSDADSMAKLCGNTRPSTQHSTGSTMYLRFRTDASITHKGFKAKYSIATCGGTYTGQSVTIKSPGFPANYPDNLACQWYLEGPTGHYLTLSYNNFSLQSTVDCNSDYVEIREYNASGRLLGKHCGNSMPTPMDTGDSFAYVKFISDSMCGGELNAPSGTISSPNYPNLYPHSRTCRWEITVVPGRRVTLTINDLRLEGTSSSSCYADYVDVLNGVAATAPHIQRLCGTVPTGYQVKSSGNTMTVVFLCGGILSDPAGGNFTSPGYLTSNYSNNLNCEWLIQNPTQINSSIVVLLEDLHLENHQTCESDYIEFRLGDSSGELLAQFCGQTTPMIPLVVSTPELWVHFQTNQAIGDLGFKAKYLFSECGGRQTGQGGIISSPAYPNIYPSPSRCAWLLEAPEGHTITLTFSYFNLEPHNTCGWDSVTIFNGGSPGSPVIGQYCGTTSPGTIQSGSNKLVVVFLADHSVSRGGFSPNYPQNFPANIECSWTIIAHEGNHLEMNFSSDFQIPDANGQCQSNYIKVWSGDSERTDGLLATGCGTTAPAPIIAPYNTITTRFQSTGTPGRGFSANYITRCGANFTAPTGRVVSPNYPADYPILSDCSYLIDVGPQTVVILEFRSFQVEAHSTCLYDGVKVYRGTHPTGTPLATLCGSTIPGPFNTLGPMLVNFYSDSIINDNGFLAEYRAIPCGGVFNSTSGTVSSPAGIDNYHHNMNCTYHIIVTENWVINLKWNTFHLEASSSCRYDYVIVYDGPNTMAPIMGQFCGTALPPNLQSTTNQMFIAFITDSSVSGIGWRATYIETLGPAQGCGGYLSTPIGMFGSPDSNGDGNYEYNMDCLWTIAMPINKVINLTFSSFELEGTSTSTCQYDYVKIFDGDNMNFPLVGKYCGRDVIPGPFVSASNFLTVHFVTDSSISYRGFNATYRAQDRLCGGTLNATNAVQTITSPMYPNAYPPFISCIWILDAPPQESVKVAVQQFNLQPSQSCNTNFLHMSDWPVGDYGQAHKFCAADHIPDFYSYGRTMHIVFKSDAFITGNGMSLTYQVAGCSRTYEQAYGYLKSPDWPNIYPHNMDCTIILMAPQNNSISLFFNSFNLESHSTCSYDYLEVRNGSTESSPLLGKYCGTALPNPIFPGTNQLYMRFKSDFSGAQDGFEITWTSSPEGCGGRLYGDHGSVTSPNYPGTYANGTHCEWGIKAPNGRVVTVTFAQISIDDPGDCQNNYLKLFDGKDASTPPIGPYCGAETNIAPFTASSHHVYVVFNAQYSVLPSGFRLTWSS